VAGRGREPSHRERWVAAKLFFRAVWPSHDRIPTSQALNTEEIKVTLSENRASSLKICFPAYLGGFCGSL